MVKKRGKTYYAVFHDPASGTRVRRSLRCTDKSAAEILEGELIRRAAREHAGLANPYEAHAKRPLTEHVTDWHAALLAKGNTKQHADESRNRVLRIVESCGFKRWGDVSSSRVQSWLGEARKGDAALSAQTANYYLQAFKGFCLWCVKDRRAAESPVKHLVSFNVETDRRHDRRAFEDDELRTLLATTRNGPTRFGMTGPDRALLYKLAAMTGLRAGEIRSLNVASFDLDGDSPTVTVGASYSKRRREDVQPLRRDFTSELRSYLADRNSTDSVFNMPHPNRLAIMLRADLRLGRSKWIRSVQDRSDRRERQEICFLNYRDNAGRVLDFHAFRHTFITNLTRGGVHPKDAQTLARHSSITLTMNRYTHTARGSVAKALDALPSLDEPRSEHERMRATGTFGSKGVSNVCQNNIRQGGKASALGHKGGSVCRIENQLENKAKSAFPAVDNAKAAVGFEPTYNGFAIRPLGPLGYAAETSPAGWWRTVDVANHTALRQKRISRAAYL